MLSMLVPNVIIIYVIGRYRYIQLPSTMCSDGCAVASMSSTLYTTTTVCYIVIVIMRTYTMDAARPILLA
jgi:hypothetical protein